MHSNFVSLTCEIELQPGERLALPDQLLDTVGPGRWRIIVQPVSSEVPTTPTRLHSAFLNGYAPEDEGLYDDAPAR